MKVNKLITHKNGTLFLSITIAKKKKKKMEKRKKQHEMYPRYKMQYQNQGTAK